VRIDTKANTQPTQYPTHLALAYTLQDVRKPLHKIVVFHTKIILHCSET